MQSECLLIPCTYIMFAQSYFNFSVPTWKPLLEPSLESLELKPQPTYCLLEQLTMLFFGLVLKPGESRSCSLLSYLFVENKSFFPRGEFQKPRKQLSSQFQSEESSDKSWKTKKVEKKKFRTKKLQAAFKAEVEKLQDQKKIKSNSLKFFC